MLRAENNELFQIINAKKMLQNGIFRNPKFWQKSILGLDPINKPKQRSGGGGGGVQVKFKNEGSIFYLNIQFTNQNVLKV
jgi:hypothetical protein